MQISSPLAPDWSDDEEQPKLRVPHDNVCRGPQGNVCHNPTSVMIRSNLNCTLPHDNVCRVPQGNVRHNPTSAMVRSNVCFNRLYTEIAMRAKTEAAMKGEGKKMQKTVAGLE